MPAWDMAPIPKSSGDKPPGDIPLDPVPLFVRENEYPWDSPAADLAAAEKLIKDCGDHRRDEELADAKRAILQ